MNRLKTIVLFAGIYGIGLGAISLNDSSATSLSILAEPSQIENEVSMLGHVEYTILDSSGSIKQYLQGDNTVAIGGKDCVSRLVFENSTSAVCPLGNNEFQHIAVGNFTTPSNDPPLNTEAELEASTPGSCAASGTTGEMSRKQVTPGFTAAVTGTGTIVTLDTVNDPFDFGPSNSSGNITQSGVFNGPELTQDGERQCATLAGTSMFAIQNLSGTTGIAVSDGDSLSVKWTITVG